MPSFGEQLRQARESQNITLQEIAATTKISARALQALESERFDQLPGGVFNKGFVRAYASYVGLDEEKMLAAYMAVAKPEAPEADMQTISRQVAASRKPTKESRLGGTTLMGILAILVALGLGGLWFREHRKEVREQAVIPAAPPATAPVAAPLAPATPATEPAAPAGTALQSAPVSTTGEVSPATTSAATPAGTVANPKPAPNATSSAVPGSAAPGSATSNATQGAPPNAAAKLSPTAPPSPLPNASGKSGPAASAAQAAPVVVSISAKQKVWISVTSDGKAIESLTLDPDVPELRSRSYKANEKLKLVVGNAGGLTVVWNGKSEGLLGTDGEVKTVTFTTQGIEKR